MTINQSLDLKELYNFVVDNFYNLKSTIQGKLHYEFLTLKFVIFKRRETIKTEVVDLKSSDL